MFRINKATLNLIIHSSTINDKMLDNSVTSVLPDLLNTQNPPDIVPN